MKKNNFFLSAAVSAFATLQLAAAPANSIELEWCCKNDTSLPYEIALDRTKLAKLAGIPQNSAIKAVAVTADGEKELDTKIIPGNTEGKELLRFTVPAGTDKLYAKVEKEEKKYSCVNSADNLFAGALQNTAKWQKTTSSTKITTDGKKLLISVNAWGSTTVKCVADLPAGYAGTSAVLEIELKSLAKLTWGGGIKVEQYDAKGRLLPDSIIQPRWISHMRVPGVKTHYQEYGFFHKDAKRIAVCFECIANQYKYDNHGLDVKNSSDALPKLEISKLAVRQAQELPFPAYNNKLFAKGVSGADGDSAIVLDGETIFHFSPNSQAVFSEGKQVKSEKECFWPQNDATVEAWINPQWKKGESKAFCLLESRNNYGPRPKDKAIRKKIGVLFNANYTPRSGNWEITVYDGTDNHHTFKFNHKLEVKKYSHVAIQYGKDGIECFINGKKVFSDAQFSFKKREISPKYQYNEQIAQVVAVGNNADTARNRMITAPAAIVDMVRISGGKRYAGNFTPAKNLKLDDKTFAFFDFDRSIDGKTANGLGIVYGSLNSATKFLRERTIVYNGNTIRYFSEKLLDGSNPDKVLNILNYPDTPSVDDFKAARKNAEVKYIAKADSRKEITLPAKTHMDYIEIACPDDVKELRHPVLVANEELDTRSFGDIADSLKHIKVTDYEKANLLFNLVLGASDYFMTHQATILAHSDNVKHASYQALTLFNSYCGFECGPLNNMAANMFSCAGLLPATQTAGYGHSFQQVFFNGKNHVYDLSAQRFFPGYDNETAASLHELDIENGAFLRWGRGSASFTRQGYTRSYSRHIPGMQKRIAYTLHPGEKARFYFYNDGNYNDIQTSRCIDPRAVHPSDPYPYSKVHRLAVKAPAETVAKEQLYQVHRPFPHYSNAYFSFSGKPSKNNKAFSRITANDFCYEVQLPYPIVAGRYTAVTTDGKNADIEISTDGGKSFRKLVTEKDGRAVYAVRARHAYYIKVKAPIDKIAKFDAYTEVMFNSRVQNCKLKEGKNSILFKSANGDRADITVAYRTDAKELSIEGAPYSGAMPGFERQLTVVEPGKSVTHTVNGASADAKVTSTCGVVAKLANGKLTITAKKDVKAPRFDNVVIDDNGAKKELTVLVSEKVRMALAKDAAPANGSKLVHANSKCVQDCIVVNKDGNSMTFKFKEIPAGDYFIWVLSRMNSQAPKARTSRDGGLQDLAYILPEGQIIDTDPAILKKGRKVSGIRNPKLVPITAGINTGSEFYKAKYGKDKGRFRWDCRLDNDHNKFPYFSPRWTAMQKCSSMTIKANFTNEIEVAAILLIPRTDRTFRAELMKILCGLNCEPWKVAAHQSK